jgi:hypothetical protein
MAMQDYLDQEVKKICPIHGISFPKLNDKSGWRINFEDSATPEQRHAAIKFIEDFVWSDELEKKQKKDLSIQEYKNDLSLKAGFHQYKKENPNAKFADYVEFLEALEVF